jgi:hypothetical protein
MPFVHLSHFDEVVLNGSLQQRLQAALKILIC